MQIAMSFAGSLAHPAKAKALKQRLEELERELKDDGLTGDLSVTLDESEQ